MKFDIAVTISIFSFIVLIGSNFIWLLKSYGDGEKKKYAAEREFQHLKRNQEQLIMNISLLFKDIDHNHDLIFSVLQEINYRVGGGKIERLPPPE
jgi:hypothetical protein